MSRASRQYRVPPAQRQVITAALANVGTDPQVTATGLPVQAFAPMAVMSDHDRVSAYTVDTDGLWSIAARRNGGLLGVDCTVTGVFAPL